MKQKGFAPVLIVLLTALGIGGYLVYNYSNIQTIVSLSNTQPLTTSESSVSTVTNISPSPTIST